MAPGNPTLVVLDQASAEALGGTLHAGTGVQRFAFGDDENSSPTLWSKWMNLIHGHLNLLTDANQGHVVALTGLNVGAFAMRYRLGAADHAFPGETSFACPASVTNHLYLDAGQVLKNDTTGWPSGDHVKLAEVITGASSVTQVIDCRFRNFLIGIINAWSTVAATAEVDLAGFGIGDLGALQLGAPSELTIAAGSITPTGIWHTLDTEADAAADDLITIVAGNDAESVGVGLFTASEEVSVSIQDKDNQTSSDTQSYQNTLAVHLASATFGVGIKASFTSMDPGGWTLNWTNGAVTARKFPSLAIGAKLPSGPGVDPLDRHITRGAGRGLLRGVA